MTPVPIGIWLKHSCSGRTHFIPEYFHINVHKHNKYGYYACFTQGHGPWSSHVFCPCVTQTDIQWMVYIQTSIESTEHFHSQLIYFCWRHYYFGWNWKEGLCFDVWRRMWVAELYERQQNFLNGEKSICNPHSLSQYKCLRWYMENVKHINIHKFSWIFKAGELSEKIRSKTFLSWHLAH